MLNCTDEDGTQGNADCTYGVEVKDVSGTVIRYWTGSVKARGATDLKTKVWAAMQSARTQAVGALP